MRYRYVLRDGYGTDHDYEYPNPQEAINVAKITRRDVVERRYEPDGLGGWKLTEACRIWTCDRGGAYV